MWDDELYEELGDILQPYGLPDDLLEEVRSRAVGWYVRDQLYHPVREGDGDFARGESRQRTPPRAELGDDPGGSRPIRHGGPSGVPSSA